MCVCKQQTVFKVEWSPHNSSTNAIMKLIGKHGNEFERNLNVDMDEKKTETDPLDSVTIPPIFASLEKKFTYGNWKFIGNVDCYGNDLLSSDDASVFNCGNRFNAVAIGKQLIEGGICAGFTVNYQGLLYPKVKMQNMRHSGGSNWSFISVNQNPKDYIFELGVHYNGHNLTHTTRSPAQPDLDNSISINDVLAILETKSSVDESGQTTNFAEFSSVKTGYNPDTYLNTCFYKDSSIIPGDYTGPSSNVPASTLANGVNDEGGSDIRLCIKYVAQ